MFEKVSRSLKYDSNFFSSKTNIYIYIYGHTTTDHFTPLALRVRCKNKSDPKGGGGGKLNPRGGGGGGGGKSTLLPYLK